MRLELTVARRSKPRFGFSVTIMYVREWVFVAPCLVLSFWSLLHLAQSAFSALAYFAVLLTGLLWVLADSYHRRAA